MLTLALAAGPACVVPANPPTDTEVHSLPYGEHHQHQPALRPSRRVGENASEASCTTCSAEHAFAAAILTL